MFTFEEITELIELVAKRQLAGLEIERSGFRLKIDGQRQERLVTAPSSESLAASPPSAPAPRPPSPAAAPSTVTEPPAAADEHLLTSPIVGTFYRAPSPDASPFAEVGTRVTKGQVLCIVEAMKLMNEIESDADGVITKIFPQNAQPVEFGEPLFSILTG